MTKKTYRNMSKTFRTKIMPTIAIITILLVGIENGIYQQLNGSEEFIFLFPFFIGTIVYLSLNLAFAIKLKFIIFTSMFGTYEYEKDKDFFNYKFTLIINFILLLGIVRLLTKISL